MSACKAILHGLLIDGTGSTPLDDCAVVIRGDRIETVGRAGEVSIPTDAERIDASGRTVMPGLIEGHAHVGGDGQAQRVLRLSLQRGVTTVCSVSSNLSGIALRDAIEARTVRGCSRLVSACIVTCTHGHVKFRTADGPWEVRKAVREMVMAGADFIKTAASGGFWSADETCSVRNYTYEELEALVDEAHAWGVPVAVHCHTQPGLNNCIRAGVDQIHHGAFIDEEAVHGIREAGLYYLPTLTVTCQYNIDGHTGNRPWMIKEMQAAQKVHRAGVRLAHRLGVKIGLGTDYPGAACWEIGEKTMTELQELVSCGLSPMEAIVAGTRTTAEAFRRLDQFGTLEPGKKADLLVVAANPLEDISLLAGQETINLVMKDGVVESADAVFASHYRIREDQPANRGRKP